MDVLFQGKVHRHIFQKSLQIRRVLCAVIVHAQPAGQVVVMVHGRFHEGVDILLFQTVIGNVIRMADGFNVRNDDAAFCLQVPVPHACVFFIVQVLEMVHFRLHPFPAPFKGIGNPITLLFKYVHPVAGHKAADFTERPVHRCFIVGCGHKHAGEAEDLVFRGNMDGLLLCFFSAAQEHEDAASPPGARRHDVAHRFFQRGCVFFSVNRMIFIGRFIGLLCPGIVFLVQEVREMAAQFFIFPEACGSAAGCIVVAADDF